MENLIVGQLKGIDITLHNSRNDNMTFVVLLTMVTEFSKAFEKASKPVDVCNRKNNVSLSGLYEKSQNVKQKFISIQKFFIKH